MEMRDLVGERYMSVLCDELSDGLSTRKVCRNIVRLRGLNFPGGINNWGKNSGEFHWGKMISKQAAMKENKMATAMQTCHGTSRSESLYCNSLT